jgi:3-hydroxybutyryl-CoA dehydrogenase
MGAGIAQLAALGGYETRLFDPDPAALERGLERLGRDLGRGAERGRWSAADAEAARGRVAGAGELDPLAECGLVVEAAPERLELKRELFAGLEAVCDADAVLATNTSSLPVAEIAVGTDRPQRICGMHFFNPPALMRLVEVVAAEATGEPALAAAEEVAQRMGRVPVRCTDSPGFIVNRCNRPYALESLRILDEGIATAPQIDRVMREDGGYRMGPFELMDLIGIDVNLEVARSFHRQRPIERWEPSPISERMVSEGRLGRKSGRGFYAYGEGGDPARDPEPEVPPQVRAAVLGRVVAQLVNEACFAVEEGVAEPDDVDTAMRLGLNHPRGPFQWARELGPQRVLATLATLAAELSAERYRAAELLRRWAAAGAADPPA